MYSHCLSREKILQTHTERGFDQDLKQLRVTECFVLLFTLQSSALTPQPFQ